MRFITVIGALAGALAWGHTAAADQRCEQLRSIVSQAGFEFERLQGPEIEGARQPGRNVYFGLLPLDGAGACLVAHLSEGERRLSTGYMCTDVGPNTEAGVAALKADLSRCLDVQTWESSPAGETSRYGLTRLLMLAGGPRLGLVFETQRDENNEPYGSPFRGDRVLENGRNLCTPRSPEVVFSRFAESAARPDVEVYEERDAIGVRTTSSNPINMFVTRPGHPAHPAVISRTLTRSEDSGFGLITSGDYAGDCQAFMALFVEALETDQQITQDLNAQ